MKLHAGTGRVHSSADYLVVPGSCSDAASSVVASRAMLMQHLHQLDAFAWHVIMLLNLKILSLLKIIALSLSGVWLLTKDSAKPAWRSAWSLLALLELPRMAFWTHCIMWQPFCSSGSMWLKYREVRYHCFASLTSDCQLSKLWNACKWTHTCGACSCVHQLMYARHQESHDCLCLLFLSLTS